MSDPDIAKGFRNVDAASETAAFASYLDAARTTLSELNYRTMSALELENGGAVLDVGCGTGDDVRRLAEIVGPHGRAVGIDLSDSLLREARARNATAPNAQFVLGDAHALPFDTHAFDASRAERVLMHVEDPAAVLAEMTRVTRPNGRVVAFEPDWDTLIIDSDDLATARRVARAQADAIRHPDIGRRLLGLATAAGLELVDVAWTTVPITDVRLAGDLFRLKAAVDALGDATASTWWRDLVDQAEERAFFAALTAIAMVCRKPPHRSP